MEDIAYDLLKELNIQYKTLTHEPIFSVRDCIKLEGQQVKNLVLKAKKSNNLYLIILHDEKSVRLDELANTLSEVRFSFASEKVLEEYLHCKPGSVTPFGLIYDKEHKLNIILDTALDTTTTVGFHPFINTKTLNILFDDLIKIFNYTGHSYRFVDIKGA